MESDFLLMVLRDLLGRKPSLKLVLMSATMNVNLFSRYFTLRGNPSVPTLKVAGRTFPVTPLYLEDALELTQHKIRPGADWMRGRRRRRLRRRRPRRQSGGRGDDDGGRGGGGRGAAASAARGARRGGRRRGGGGGERRGRSRRSSRSAAAPRSQSVRDAMEKLDFEAINVELVVELLKWLRTCRVRTCSPMESGARRRKPRPHQQKNVAAAGGGSADAVLVFLQGFRGLSRPRGHPDDARVRPRTAAIGSCCSVPRRTAEGLRPPPPGARKVVLAANIAERRSRWTTSYVIDCGT